MEITPELVEEHGLTPDEYEEIKRHLGREPNYLELGIFSVMWSEHCSYKSSRVHLKGFPTDGECVIEGPGENAGVIDIGEGLACVFKMESHNHPSFIEPFQGAATGVGGIMRDVFTMGARPVANLNALRFGAPGNNKTPFLLEGVVEGIAAYGNCMGVPTVGGELTFNESYNGNCLVNAMTVGTCKTDKIFRGYASGVGNPIIYVGSKTGRDGIHGAVMASDVFGEGGEERRPTVQVGDPFTEKLLLEACLEIFKTDYVVGIQDMGAAGLTSSSIEMASRAGLGIEMDLSRIPCREEGMTPYEMMLSESQERMLMVVNAGDEAKASEIFHKWDLEATVIGRVTEGEGVRLTWGDELIGDMPVAALTDAAPVYERPIERPAYQDDLQKLDLSEIPVPEDLNETLLTLMASANLASRRFVYRQYDHMVRTDSVVRPGSDAAVVRIKGSQRAMAITTDCNPRYCYLDPFEGARMAVAEAARNITASGGRPLAITDCLNFGSPEVPAVMWQFKEAVRGLASACIDLNTPVVSGNVSFYNQTGDIPVYPTPAVGMVGLIDDLALHTTQWFEDEGDIIVLIGETFEELGGSEYLSVIHGIERGVVPKLDIHKEKIANGTCLDGIKAGIIKSAHDLSDGGLAVAIAESCLNPKGLCGATVKLGGAIRADALLFGESQSRYIVTTAPADLESLKELAKANGAPLSVLGTVGQADGNLTIEGLIDISITDIHRRWDEALEELVS